MFSERQGTTLGLGSLAILHLDLDLDLDAYLIHNEMKLRLCGAAQWRRQNFIRSRRCQRAEIKLP